MLQNMVRFGTQGNAPIDNTMYQYQMEMYQNIRARVLSALSHVAQV